MLLEYSYDKVNKVIDLFRKSAVASLSIKKAGHLSNPKYVMEYRLVEEFDGPKQNRIIEALNNSLVERLNIVSVLNTFIEKQSLDLVNDFSLSFNAIGVKECQIDYSFSYKNTPEDTACPIVELEQCLENYDRLITKLGVADQTVPNIYKREGTGRSKKNIPVTLQEVSCILRQALASEE